MSDSWDAIERPRAGGQVFRTASLLSARYAKWPVSFLTRVASLAGSAATDEAQRRFMFFPTLD